MSGTLKHAFQSTVVDGNDTTRLRPSDWNAAHVFSGGADGYLLTRDGGESSGASWAQRTLGNSASDLAVARIAARKNDLSGDYFRIDRLNNDDTLNNPVFQVNRGGGVRVWDYFMVAPQAYAGAYSFDQVFAHTSMFAAYPDIAAGANASVLYAVSSGLNVDLLHMDALGSIDGNGKITGARRFTFDTNGNAIATTSWMAPYLFGGAAVDSILELRSTTGNANNSSAIKFTTGNNGSVLGLTMNYQGRIGIGIAPVAVLHVKAAEARIEGSGNDVAYWSFFASNGTTRRGYIGNGSGGSDLDVNAETGFLLLAGSSGYKLTTSLPTADPHVNGQLWRSGTALQISLG